MGRSQEGGRGGEGVLVGDESTPILASSSQDRMTHWNLFYGLETLGVPFYFSHTRGVSHPRFRDPTSTHPGVGRPEPRVNGSSPGLWDFWYTDGSQDPSVPESLVGVPALCLGPALEVHGLNRGLVTRRPQGAEEKDPSIPTGHSIPVVPRYTVGY